MLILLPPSQGKTTPQQGPPLDLAALVYPELAAQRSAVLQALAAASARDDARDVLKVGASVSDQIAHNLVLHSAPTAPAHEVYTGVLFTAAGLGSLTAVQAARAERSVRIFSGLWGVIRPSDQIPAYRLSMATVLPLLGPLAAAWREPLAAVLDDAMLDGAMHEDAQFADAAGKPAGQVIVDCRSSTYVSAWRPPRDTPWVSVAVLRERDGRRTVVSHHAKHLRGVVVRHLLTRRGGEPRTARDVLQATRALIGTEVSGEPVIDVQLVEGTDGRSTLQVVTG